MKIGVIADDLTGANATGVRLSKQGLRAVTLLHSSTFPTEAYNVVLMDTDSRYASSETAEKRVIESVNALDKWGASIVAKRIDSTLRGNVGTELDAILSYKKDLVAVVAPSFPDSGRVVSGGYLLVDGVPLEQTEAGNDPIKPIKHTFLPDLIREQSTYDVTSLTLSDILKPEPELTKIIEEKVKEGYRIICCDAVSNKNLETIARSLSYIESKIFMPVDPGPLTDYYAQYMRKEEKKVTNPILVMVGSATSLTGRQLEYLKETTTAGIVHTNAEHLASYTDSWNKEVENVKFKALNLLKENELIIITTHKPGFGLIDLERRSKEEGYSEDALAKRIADGLGSIFREIVESASFKKIGCFSSGGDVTASICAFSRADGIELKDEVIPLAAYGALTGGYFHGMPIVTKGGMIGNDTSIYQCVQYLKNVLKKNEGVDYT